MIGSREGSDDGAGSTKASADFFVEEDIEAAGMMKERGIVVDAVVVSSGCGEGRVRIPRSALGANVLERDIILNVLNRRRVYEEN